jgi:hypothetical protein
MAPGETVTRYTLNRIRAFRYAGAMLRALAGSAVVVVTLALAPVAGAADCDPIFPQGPTRVVDTPPPADLLAHLEVLRRPQNGADRAFAVRFNGSGIFRTILGPSIRLLGRSDNGTDFYLVPGTQTYPRLRRRCLRGLSPRRRRAEERRRRQSRTVRLSTFGVSPSGGSGGGGGADLRGLLSNRTTLTMGQRDGSAIASGLAPDGVATIELVFEGLNHRTSSVANNFWWAQVPLSPPHAFPVVTVWKAADGTVVKRFRDQGGA